MDGNNVPLGAIQRILGHENRKTTEIYLHSIGDLEREAVNAFERAREKSHTDDKQKKRELPGDADNPLI
jgi:integrase